MQDKSIIARQILETRSQIGPEEYVSRTFALTEDPRLIDAKINLGERTHIATILLIDIINGSRGSKQKESKETKKEEETKEEKVEAQEKVQEEKPPPEPEPKIVPNHYETLGVPKDATQEEVKDAYRDLKRKYHPDYYIEAYRKLSDEEKGEIHGWLENIDDSYLILNNEENRKDYDALIAGPGVELFTPSPPAFLVEAGKEAAGRIVGEVEKRAVEAGLKTGGKIAAKAGFEVGKKAAEVAAAPAPGVNIAVFIASEVLPRLKKAFEKIVSGIARFFGAKDQKELRRTIFLGAFFGGLYLVSSGNVVAGGALVTFSTLGGVGELSLATKGAGAKIGGITESVVAGVTSVAFPAIGIPILIAAVAAPFLVAIFLFIINSGAYLVPPSQILAAEENPYIEITKTANPTRADNPGPDVVVTYTVEIRAKLSTLTVVSIQDSCQTITRSGASPACEAPNPAIPLPGDPDYPVIISPVGDGYTLTYTRTFDSRFRDSLVVNTFTIVADVPEQSGVEASASAGVCIGDCPEECPSVWPILPQGGESSLPVIQGPQGPFSHQAYEAIDVAASTGHNITATHSGVVEVPRPNNPNGWGYGYYLLIHSQCTVPGGQNVAFSSLYAHLTSVSVPNGSAVTLGQSVGTSGNSGTGPGNYHLHYEFKPFGSPIRMETPWIPKTVPRGCWNYAGTPCNITIP